MLDSMIIDTIRDYAEASQKIEGELIFIAARTSNRSSTITDVIALLFLLYLQKNQRIIKNIIEK